MHFFPGQHFFNTNEETLMSKRLTLKTLATVGAFAVGAMTVLGSTAVQAQQKLNWALTRSTSAL
jgi:hypothetical protein